MKLSPGNCNKPDHFIELYSRLLEGREPERILEIGVQRGDSLRMWASAFPKAEVVGLDVELKMGLVPTNVRCVEGDQGDTKLLQELGRFDFVVDDGSHMSKDQQTSFETLFPLMNEGGIYVIEDLELDRQHEFKNSPLSTSEYFIEKLAPIVVQNTLIPAFKRDNIKSITFADNLLVVEKL